MELGNKFKSVTTGEIFTVEEINEKFGQIIVADEDGKTKAYSASTLKDKRRFTPITDEPAPSVDESVGLKEEEETKKVPTVKKPVTGIGADVKDYIVAKAKEAGAEICEASSGKFISFKINGKMFAAIFSWSKKAATLGVRSEAIKGSGITCNKQMNHMMDFRFTFDSLEDTATIDTLIALAKEHQINRTNKGGH